MTMTAPTCIQRGTSRIVSIEPKTCNESLNLEAAVSGSQSLVVSHQPAARGELVLFL